MAVSCSIFLRERGNEGNLFNMRSYATTWSFQLLRRNGCGPATFTAVMSDDEWAALEAQGLLVADTVVQFFLNMNESAEHRTWSGTLKSFPLDKNTPPSRRVRKFTCAPVWSQLKKPGCLLLRAFDADETVQAIVQGLVSSIADHTDVHTATTDVTAGGDFSPGRTLFIDQEAAQCVEKCAQVYGDVVYGVEGSDDKLYFADETSEIIPPVVTFRMGTHADGVVKFTRTTQVRRDQANHYVVKGREAKAGNPMTVEYEDPALATDPSMLRRTKKVSAPDNVKGATLLRWAEYLVNRDKGPKTVAVLAIAGIDTKFTEEGDVIRTWQQVNGNVGVEDEDGNAISYWPIQGVTYSMANTGEYGAKFELGDELQQDLVDAFGLRDTLREIAVYDLKEFSNQVELNAANDDWLDTAYIFFVLNHEMRNSVRVSLQSLRHIDFDHSSTSGIITEAVDNGITGLIDADDETVIGQFVSQQIPVGMHYDDWALLRNVEYPRVIEGQEDAGSGHFWSPYPLPPHRLDAIDLHWRSVITEGLHGPEEGLHTRPFHYNQGNPVDYYGVALHKKRIHPSAHIDWICHWRRARNELQDSAYLIFGYTDDDNYHFIELTDDPDTENMLRWRAGRYIDRIKTYSDSVMGSIHIFVASEPWRRRYNFRIEPNPSADMYVFRVRRWNTDTDDWSDWVTQAVPPNWYNPSDATHAVGVGQRWDALAYDSWDTVQAPSWLRLTFDSCVAGDDWYISRDGGDSWEGPFNPDTGGKVTLGAYAGGGTEKDYVLIKGYVAAPQILAGYAGGWK